MVEECGPAEEISAQSSTPSFLSGHCFPLAGLTQKPEPMLDMIGADQPLGLKFVKGEGTFPTLLGFCKP